MEQPDILTDLSSSETDSETDHRRFSSASLVSPLKRVRNLPSLEESIGGTSSLDVTESSRLKTSGLKSPTDTSNTHTNTVIHAKPNSGKGKSDSVRNSQGRRRLTGNGKSDNGNGSSENVKGNLGMGMMDLEALLIEAHADLDRLVEYTFSVVEENNSLKEILKEAVIVSDDGRINDYSETLITFGKQLPILKSLSHRSFLSLASPPHTHTHTQSHNHSHPVAATSSTASNLPQSEPMFHLSLDGEHIATVPEATLNMPTQASVVNNQSETRLAEHEESTDTVIFPEERPSLFTISLPQPTVAETSIQAMATQSTIEQRSPTQESKAALSIKKLHSLTITDSWKDANENRVQGGNNLQSKSDSLLSAGGLINSPRFGTEFGKRKQAGGSFSEGGSYSRGTSEREGGETAKDEKPTSEFARQENGEKDDNAKQPKFFTSDMMSLILERNELKEKVLHLEDNLNAMEVELRRVNVELANVHDAFDFGDVTTRRTSFFKRTTKLRNRVSVHESDRYISAVLVIGYKKRDGAYVYVIHTTWSDGQRFEIYRRYGEFFTYHDRLLQVFPAEAGKYKSTERVLPTLPTIDNVLSLFGRTNNESVVKQRLDTINNYCQTLLIDLDANISKDDFIVSFFRPQPGDKQLQSLARPRAKSDLNASILSVYPQHIPSGSTFEEYSLLADYEPKAEGELQVKAGEIVKVINREATGWWLVCQTKDNGNDKEEMGYVPGDFLRRFDRPHMEIDNSVEVRKKYLGFVSPAAMTESIIEEVDSILKYVAIEDYSSSDPRQISFTEGAELIVVEKSEDGWWLVTLEGRQGWAPASFLEPLDRRSYPEGENLVVSLKTDVDVSNAEKYITKAAFKGQVDEDISFPEKATIEVIEKSISGWWMVRYKGRLGMAPASMLALTETQLKVPKEYKFALTVDLGHGVSGIIAPPPRSKKFLMQSQCRQRANTNTDENTVGTILEEAQFSNSSSSSSEEDNENDMQTRHASMSRHVRKRVITNEKRKKKLNVNFKSFVRPGNVKQKQYKPLSESERRGTAPAALFKGRRRTKKLNLEGMSVFIASPTSALSSEESPLTQRPKSEIITNSGFLRSRSVSNDDRMISSLREEHEERLGFVSIAKSTDSSLQNKTTADSLVSTPASKSSDEDPQSSQPVSGSAGEGSLLNKPANIPFSTQPADLSACADPVLNKPEKQSIDEDPSSSQSEIRSTGKEILQAQAFDLDSSQSPKQLEKQTELPNPLEQDTVVESNSSNEYEDSIMQTIISL